MIFTPKTVLQPKDNVRYVASHKKEIDVLLNRGVLIPEILTDGREHSNYKSRFVDHVKNDGTPKALEKSRFVLSAFDDDVEFLTHAQSVTRTSKRLLPSIALSGEESMKKNPDVNKAYTQANSKQQRNIFTRPTPDLGYPPDFLLRAVFQTYKLLKPSPNWFHCYWKCHKEKLYIMPSVQ